MFDYFTGLFSRFCQSEDTKYGSPQQIEPEPQEESNEPAAKEEQKQAAIEEKKASIEPASPTSSEQKITPKKTTPLPGLMYPDDIKALTNHYGVLSSGMTLELGLHDALDLMPRRRRRCEAYQGLQSYLRKEFGVELKVVSPRDKNKGGEDGPSSKLSANNKN